MLAGLPFVGRIPLCRACRISTSRYLSTSRVILPDRELVSRSVEYYQHRSDAVDRIPNRTRIGGVQEERPGHPSIPKPLPPSLAAIRSPPSKLTADVFRPPTPPSPFAIVQLITQRLGEYIKSERFRKRLEDYGIGIQSQTALLRQWERDVRKSLSQAKDEQTANVVLAQGDWDAENLSRAFVDGTTGFATAVEPKFHRNFLHFVANSPSTPPPLASHLKSILDTTDLTNIAYEHGALKARSIVRHFHLHIGPTNSGKTYNALRALAQADTGVYAGPLRLLAHEVWERLNLGTVGGLDGVGKQCNLMTGEERRIVDPNAGLTSCTVEMLPMGGPPGGYDVVVIDEIQMLGDPNRGGAWTKAVVNVCAKEIHLCGDETTLELLKDLIPSIGDQLTIHRYDRLTPLSVADKSLGGDFNKIEEGDCVVTFSRSNIYAIKKKIEGLAAKKCAVVYGALPPETRADQAKDFNDPDGRCQVLVASDAVGMGLNLKIKRIIFESLEKFDGKKEVPLALTQIKQIAGRAGRFGMQRKTTEGEENDDPVKPDEEAQPGGVVTTLFEPDLKILREVLPMELPKVKRATCDVPLETRSQLAMLLPADLPYSDVLDHLSALVRYPPNMKGTALEQILPVADILEPFRDYLSLEEIELFLLCPLSRRDPNVLAVYQTMLKQYTQAGLVQLETSFKPTRFLSMLDIVEATIATLPPIPPIWGIGRPLLTPPVIVSSLPALESMHKSLIMYIWLSFRLEIAFPERQLAQEYKARVEKVLEECLARFPGLRQLKTHERTKEGDRAVADWRKANVAPNGTKKIYGADSKGIKWVPEAVVQRLRNKQIWASSGVVQPGKVLREADGKGPLGVAPPQIVAPRPPILAIEAEKRMTIDDYFGNEGEEDELEERDEREGEGSYAHERQTRGREDEQPERERYAQEDDDRRSYGNRRYREDFEEGRYGGGGVERPGRERTNGWSDLDRSPRPSYNTTHGSSREQGYRGRTNGDSQLQRSGARAGFGLANGGGAQYRDGRQEDGERFSRSNRPSYQPGDRSEQRRSYERYERE